MANLTLELAQKIVDHVLEENRPIHMDSFMENIKIPEHVKPSLENARIGDVIEGFGRVSNSFNHPYGSIDVAQDTAAKITCGTPACLCGTAMILDNRATSLGLCIHAPTGFMSFESITINGEEYDLIEYSRWLFGDSYGRLIHVGSWPTFLSRAYGHSDSAEDAAFIALVRLKGFCDQHFNFAPTLPQHVTDRVDEILNAIN